MVGGARLRRKVQDGGVELGGRGVERGCARRGAGAWRRPGSIRARLGPSGPRPAVALFAAARCCPGGGKGAGAAGHGGRPRGALARRRRLGGARGSGVMEVLAVLTEGARRRLGGARGWWRCQCDRRWWIPLCGSPVPRLGARRPWRRPRSDGCFWRRRCGGRGLRCHDCHGCGEARWLAAGPIYLSCHSLRFTVVASVSGRKLCTDFGRCRRRRRLRASFSFLLATLWSY